MEPGQSAPSPRRRPSSRREAIAANAGELFTSRGFHAVRMDHIAEASGITARALYRHYDSKQHLLAHVVLEDQRRVMDAIATLDTSEPGEPLEQRLTVLTQAAMAGRSLSLLWQREARHLAPDDYRQVRRQTTWMARRFRELLVETERDDLDEQVSDVRSWVVISIVSGHSLYDSSLSRAQLVHELAAAAARVIRAPVVAAPGEAVHATADRTSVSRREQLLHAATRAFRERGYGGVSLDEIGGEVGIVGPALYRYFGAKADLLVAAVNRWQEWLALELTRALRAPVADGDVFAHVVDGHIRLTLEATDPLAVALTERLWLPEAVRDDVDRVQADYLDEWQRWLGAASADLSRNQAATLVRVAKTIVDDLVRIPHLRSYPGLAGELAHAVHSAVDTATPQVS